MSYVVLARKWRPQSFEDLAGQGHVSTTLENAIAKNRVAHAFLFTGVRGVGKTTSARILAKALNCVKGPTAHPCQVCSQCTEITAGQDLDVQEIDGASYNGVDEVRRLQETLPYRPARDRFKIFIVDEVHMLSNAAWNAFLKTLEEPPPHVKFIFATTEVHKVPVTILSRCQRYDFKLIGASTIAARLRFVLEREKVAFDDAAVHVLAREAAGSMRDAMSLLDQVLASLGGAEGERLTAEGVARVLGVADRVVLHRLASALVAGDAGGCLAILNDLAQEGYDLPHVARDFLAHLRDLVVAKVSAEPGKLLDLADEELADVKAVASGADVDDLARIHQGFSRAFDDISKGGQPRQSLEMTLVRLARRPPLLPLEELLKRLGDLERRVLGGAGSSGGGGGDRQGPRGGGPPAPRRPGPGASSEPASPAAPYRPASAEPRPAAPSTAPPAQQPRATAPPVPATWPVDTMGGCAPQTPCGVADTPLRSDAITSAERRSTVSQDAITSAERRSTVSQDAITSAERRSTVSPDAITSAERRSTVSQDATPSAQPRSTVSPDAIARAEGRSTPLSDAIVRPEGRSTPPQDATARVEPRPAASALGRAPVAAAELGAWRAILGRVRARRPALASVLEHAALLALGPGGVAIGYEKGSFLVGQATDAAARELLAAAVDGHFGAHVDVAFETVERGHGAVTLAAVEGAERKVRVDAARRAVEEHPLVTAAIRVLGAELKDVRLAETAEV